MVGHADDFRLLVDELQIGIHAERLLGEAGQRGATKFAEDADGLLHGERQADELEGDVDAATTGQTENLDDRVGGAGIDGHAAEFFREGEFLRVEVDGVNRGGA